MTNDTNNPPTTSLALVPRSFTECTSLAESLAKSGLLPPALKGKVPDVLMTIMAGQELGMPPIAALRSIHVIEGKTVLSSDAMVAIVLKSGAAVYFKRISADDEHATYETLRRGESQPQRVTWTWTQAKNAGLNTKDNWRLYRRAMLCARAKAELARDVYADVLAGCYTSDEIDVEPMPPIDYGAKSDVVDADFTETKSAPGAVEHPTNPAGDASLNEIAGALVASIYATTTIEQLAPLRVEADKIAKGTTARKTVVAAIKQQDAKLKQAVAEQVANAQPANDTQPQPTVEASAS